VQYGPRVHAAAALAVCANYLPVARAARLVAALTGVSVSAGFTAGIRGKAAARLGPFMDRVRVLLHAAGVLYAGETPARVAGHLHYVHVACTEFLTAMHTGDRTKEAIDAGGVLPGYAGTIVRDGYKGYEHLTDALHAWCGARGLRDLAGLYRFDPEGQVWARAMADLLIDANAAGGARPVVPRRLPKDLATTTAAMGYVDIDPNHGENEGTRWFMTESESIPYSAEADVRIPTGTVIPGVIVAGEFSGDRADVRCAARWASGHWALEVARRLDTNSQYDVPIKTGVFMRVAAFDHSQIRHTRHVRPIRIEVE